MSILYIDDDQEDREIFREALETISPDIVYYEASDGSEGFKILDGLNTLPNYIFLDINMPKMDGKQFLLELKQSIPYHVIPVIIYSTTNQVEEQMEYLQMGAKECHVKDGSFDFICQTIKSILDSELSEQEGL